MRDKVKVKVCVAGLFSPGPGQFLATCSNAIEALFSIDVMLSPMARSTLYLKYNRGFMRPLLFLPHPGRDNGRFAHIKSFQPMTPTVGECARGFIQFLHWSWGPDLNPGPQDE